MTTSPAVFVLDALRTPRGKGNDKGRLAPLTPVELLAQVTRALIAKHGLSDPRRAAAIVDAQLGCVTQTEAQGGNLGRLALLRAGLPDSVPASTINRFCASSLSAVGAMARAAQAEGGLALAGGVEMMSRVPMASDHAPVTHDVALQLELGIVPIGIAADALATVHGLSREAVDGYALASQERAARAVQERRFLSVVPVRDAGGEVLLDFDETPRPSTSTASLAKLPAAFEAMGAAHGPRGFNALAQERLGIATPLAHVHTAGNSPAPADGAALVLVGTAAAAEAYNIKPRARLLSAVDVGSDRTWALTGIVLATERALARAQLQARDIDIFEVNESFAAVMLHYQRAFALSAEQLNPNGGAIALGHPMGATGAVLVGMAIDELERTGKRRALVAIGGATGLSSAVILERV